MFKDITQALGGHPVKTAGPELVKGASRDVMSVSGGVQADQIQAGKLGKATIARAPPQGALPVFVSST